MIEYLVEEENLTEDEIPSTTDAIELKRLELQDKEKECEAQLKMKEMELRGQELALQLKLKELEIATASTAPPVPTSRQAEFDVTKQVRFVPPFQETKVDKYFLHFEKVASSFSWPKQVWTLLLQSSLLGKAYEAYSTLSIEQNSDYDTVKRSILKAYKFVPEAYRQRFRATQKTDTQTFVEFAQAKETLFDCWCTSKGVDGDFNRLRQLLMMEEFKNCLPSDIRTYVDEQKVDNLHEAAVYAENYSLTHTTSFGKPHPCDGNPADTTLELAKGDQPGALIISSFTGGGPSGNYSSNHLSAGPTCFYCRKKGHVMSECQALPRKNERSEKPDLTISPSFQTDHKKTSKLPVEYTHCISCGSVSLVGSQVESPITILRDTAVSNIGRCPSLQFPVGHGNDCVTTRSRVRNFSCTTS